MVENDLSKLLWYLDKVTMDFQFVDLSEGFHEAVKENNLTVLSMLYDAYPDVEWARYLKKLVTGLLT